MNIECSGCGRETNGSVNYAVRLPGLNRWFILPQCPDCREKSHNRALREQATRVIADRKKSQQETRPPENQ